MTKLIHHSASSLFILAFIFCPQALGGSGGGKAASEIKAGIGPAGVIESLGAVRVDGRIARSGTILWGNELLQAPGVESAQITLGEIGLITLPGGSIIKLASVMRAEGGAPTLFAYLLTGAMTIKLNDRANARICAAAQRIDVGIMRITASRSTPGPKRSRKRSPNVVYLRRQSGAAIASPTTMRQNP